MFVVAIAVFAGSQTLLAQFRPAPPQQARPIPQTLLQPSPQTNRPLWQSQQSQPVPSDAYHRIDTHSQIDPNFLRAQQDAEKAREKARQVEAIMKDKEYQLLAKSDADPWLRQHPNRAALSAAVYIVATNQTISQLQGSAAAENYILSEKRAIRAEIERLKKTQMIMAANDTFVAGSAAIAGKQPDGVIPQGTGTAAGAAGATGSVIAGLESELEMIDKLMR